NPGIGAIEFQLRSVLDEKNKVSIAAKVIPLLKDTSTSVRAAAIDLLAELGPSAKAAIQPLTALLKSKEHGAKAARAIERLGSESLPPLLKKAGLDLDELKTAINVLKNKKSTDQEIQKSLLRLGEMHQDLGQGSRAKLMLLVSQNATDAIVPLL